MVRWLALALALAFPSVTLTVAATIGDLAIHQITAVAQELPQAPTPPRRKKAATPAPSQTAKADIPRRYLTRYRKACRPGETWTDGSRRYACWAVLAGVGKVESGHGANMGPSSAGALGPMQFMPGTWPSYGHGDVYDPANAIPAARRYLLAHGARTRLAWALAAYNAGPGRADNPPAVTRRYVANVRALARQYEKG